MKSIVTIILLVFTAICFGQKNAKLDDGTIIIVYPNKTWKYESEVKKPDYNSNSIFVEIRNEYFLGVQKYPSIYSLEMKLFDKTAKVELIGYTNGFFKIKDINSKIAYISTVFIDENYDNISKYCRLLDGRAIEKAKSEGKFIYIDGVSVTKINSANGVDFDIKWGYFDTSKEIKYITFTVIPYNQVGDIQICQINGNSTFRGKVTGPILAEDKFNYSNWEATWYNNTISCIKLTKVEVNYMDGTSNTFLPEQIFDSEYVNSCE